MTPPAELLKLAERDEHKRCFTYCGPDKCNCPAREAFSALSFVAPALPVLETMCSKAGLTSGAAKAAEMNAEVRKVLERDQ